MPQATSRVSNESCAGFHLLVLSSKNGGILEYWGPTQRGGTFSGRSYIFSWAVQKPLQILLVILYSLQLRLRYIVFHYSCMCREWKMQNPEVLFAITIYRSLY